MISPAVDDKFSKHLVQLKAFIWRCFEDPATSSGNLHPAQKCKYIRANCNNVNYNFQTFDEATGADVVH